MLFPRPPAPGGRSREVAAMVVAHKQVARIAPGHVIQIPDKPAPPEHPAAASSSEEGDPPTRRAGLEGLLSRNGHDTPV